MVKVKFVKHLMPEILVPNLSGLNHFDLGSVKPGPKNGPVWTHQFLAKPTAFLNGRFVT